MVLHCPFDVCWKKRKHQAWHIHVHWPRPLRQRRTSECKWQKRLQKPVQNVRPRIEGTTDNQNSNRKINRFIYSTRNCALFMESPHTIYVLFHLIILWWERKCVYKHVVSMNSGFVCERAWAVEKPSTTYFSVFSFRAVKSPEVSDGEREKCTH